MEKLATTTQELTELEKELSAYGACDPVKVEEKRRAVICAREAAVRWTGKLVFHPSDRVDSDGASNEDNFCVLLSYFTRQTGSGALEIRNFLDVGDDYEDIC